MTTELTLCCLLWAQPGQESALTAYEDRVLAYVPESGGEVVQRVAGDGADGNPHEVQIYRFPSAEHLQRYLDDPRRLTWASERDRVVARTELFPVTVV